jgi:signal transduction histidine kinase
MPSSECNGGRQPAGFRAVDGTLWFPTLGGIAVFDPRAIRTNVLAPPVVLEEITTDRRSLPVGGPVELAPGERRLEVRYTANTFVHPEGARFRHRLVGYDDDWVDAGDRRFAQYAQIPPGRYELRVIAANSDGVWNLEGTKLPIRVLPFWWQTDTFRWGVPLLALGLLATGYRRRVSVLKRRRQEQDAFARRLIESQEAERKRIAGELHDGIGQSLAAIRNHALLGLREGINPLQQMAEIAAVAEEGVEDVRKVAYGLRPYQLDRLGLKRALEAVIEQTAASSGLPIDAEVGEVNGVFRRDDEINVYRILQESLNNLVRHAKATHGRVAVVVADASVELTIEDDGVGFDTAMVAAGRGGLGLSGIAERARILGGRSTVRSSPGEGTVVTVTLPREPKS